jgi:hypothetical protein
MSKYPNIDNPSPIPFYAGSLADHYSTDVIDEFFSSTGRNAIKSERNSAIGWTYFDRNSRLVFYYSIDRDYRGLPFIGLHLCFGSIPDARFSDVTLNLLRENSYLIAPVKYSILFRNVVALEFSIHFAWLTPEHLMHRLHSLVNFGLASKQRFINSDFGLEDLTDADLTMPPYGGVNDE